MNLKLTGMKGMTVMGWFKIPKYDGSLFTLFSYARKSDNDILLYVRGKRPKVVMSLGGQRALGKRVRLVQLLRKHGVR